MLSDARGEQRARGREGESEGGREGERQLGQTSDGRTESLHVRARRGRGRGCRGARG